MKKLVLTLLGLSLLALSAPNLLLAQQSESDELKISIPGGPTIYDDFIPEGGATAPEPVSTFAGGPTSVPPPIPLVAAVGLPGTSVLLLTEPAGEPTEPGETPIIFPGPNGPVVVSDLVLSTLGNQAGAPPFISFVSDGGPDLAQLVALLPPTTPFIAETGKLQDVSGLLPPAVFGGTPITIGVASDVTVPEPSTVALLGVGAIGMIGCGVATSLSGEGLTPRIHPDHLHGNRAGGIRPLALSWG